MASDRFSVYNHLHLERRQIFWAHVIRDLTANAERPGASAEFGAELLELQRKLFAHWHRSKEGTIDWPNLQPACGPSGRAPGGRRRIGDGLDPFGERFRPMDVGQFGGDRAGPGFWVEAVDEAVRHARARGGPSARV
jgi:hypothetical protein